MITIENLNVYNIARAVYSARNALNSWDKSDSDLSSDILGEADLTLARRLCRAGSDHRKFLRQILVSMDITAPLYWWKEFDTYKVGTVANSCSTMHTIHKKPFELDDFSHEHLNKFNLNLLDMTIRNLNTDREHYLETKDKSDWLQMIQTLPSSYNQRRTITLNYEVALNLYRARKNHKLPEWHTLCDHIKAMPYFAEICLEG
jgi:hypothetical protein